MPAFRIFDPYAFLGREDGAGPPAKVAKPAKATEAASGTLATLDALAITPPETENSAPWSDAPKSAAIIKHDGSPAPITADAGWWRNEYANRAAHREVGGARPRAEAERVAWGEAQWRWHKEHGERVSRERCAGCRRPIGTEAMLDLIDSNRVHDRAGNGCLIRHGKRWRAAATRALVGMGLQPPEINGAP